MRRITGRGSAQLCIALQGGATGALGQSCWNNCLVTQYQPTDPRAWFDAPGPQRPP